MSDETRVKATIYVTGLDPTTTTSSTLYTFFLPFGPITDVHLPLDKSTSLPKGFAYVEFTDAIDASAAIDNFDQAELFGRVIRVSQAKNLGFREGGAGRVESGLGSKVAVWEQEGWLKKHEVDEEDRKAVERAKIASSSAGGGGDPMEGLEGLDVAGPKLKG
ncbi:hypothetical protein TWF225_005096 [Orbilia oligospora]|uniref:Uncharacterized protein n=1 Tax=Orbilia oligospora TaxID=2813651 RepID=A0A7C8PYR9_ORBOL|nr:hypothetical protein TWF751_000060 [Orbilia oligospora]KAF3185708.1 hypothetical protein TWF225_005096 [Orbilia oligospora]KAF3251555.1 hypothetical protein TWF128_007221 [Orbilia oligospora]KAF3256859.1 hypothetical protein TWF217_006178 [Orbilia oligospora]TGJ64396.1 hypothetical protein EYR41_010455 [Orbilia oligospora]